MSKRYPPIYSIIALIALVIVIAKNTNGATLYVANTIVKTLAALTSNMANQLGFMLASGFAAVSSFTDTIHYTSLSYQSWNLHLRLQSQHISQPLT